MSYTQPAAYDQFMGRWSARLTSSFLRFADLRDGTPPSTAQLVLAAENQLPNAPPFWLNWTKFDYLYVLFTEDDAPNPLPSRLRLVADGDRFQLYRITKPQQILPGDDEAKK